MSNERVTHEQAEQAFNEISTFADTAVTLCNEQLTDVPPDQYHAVLAVRTLLERIGYLADKSVGDGRAPEDWLLPPRWLQLGEKPKLEEASGVK